MPQYDLLCEPWLTCVGRDGGRRPYALCDLLADAHSIKEVAEPSPLVTFGAYRLLLAVVHWLKPIRTARDWRSAWDAGRFPQSLLDDLTSKGVGRFDLFDGTAPFYQHPAEATGGPVSVAYVAPELPSGVNINHFCHVYDEQHAFCPGCAAKGLILLPAFAPALTWCYPASINGSPPLYVMPTGQDLFSTLMLNLPVGESGDLWGEPPPPNDTPAWARSRPHTGGARGGACRVPGGLDVAAAQDATAGFGGRWTLHLLWFRLRGPRARNRHRQGRRQARSPMGRSACGREGGGEQVRAATRGCQLLA